MVGCTAVTRFMLGARTDSRVQRDLPTALVPRTTTPHRTPIEEYAVLGDTETAALVSRAGSIDWLCLPRFDSHACFAALLGTPEHGRWLLGPDRAGPQHPSLRRDSFVLETIHETDTGAVKVLDLMPLGDGRADIIRSVQGVRGTRPDAPRVGRPVRLRQGPPVGVARRRAPPDSDVITAVAGPDMLVLRGTRLPERRRRPPRRRVRGRRRARTNTFSTTWFPSYEPVPPPLDIDSPHRRDHRASPTRGPRGAATTAPTANRWCAPCSRCG